MCNTLQEDLEVATIALARIARYCPGPLLVATAALNHISADIDEVMDRANDGRGVVDLTMESDSEEGSTVGDLDNQH